MCFQCFAALLEERVTTLSLQLQLYPSCWMGTTTSTYTNLRMWVLRSDRHAQGDTCISYIYYIHLHYTYSAHAQGDTCISYIFIIYICIIHTLRMHKEIHVYHIYYISVYYILYKIYYIYIYVLYILYDIYYIYVLYILYGHT